MKTIKNIFRRLGLVGSGLLIATSMLFGLVPVVHAASCNTATATGSLGLVNMYASASVPDTATKVGAEITPVSAWGSLSKMNTSIQLAKNDCSIANVTAGITIANDVLRVYVQDSNHVGSYVQANDLSNAASGITYYSYSNTSQNITYQLTGIPTGTAVLASFDISTPGKLAIYLKQGSGVDTLLGEVTIASSAVKFLNYNNGTSGADISYSEEDQAWSGCSDITSGGSAKGRILIDGVPADMTLQDTANDACSNLTQNSYDNVNKTATFKFIKASDATSPLNANIKLPQFDQAKQISTLAYKSLNTDTNGFKDPLVTSTSNSQSLYLIQNFNKDTNGFTQNTSVVIAGGTFDMSKGDINASSIVLDTSNTDHKAVAHGLAQLTTDKKFTLFVPYKEGDNYVGICPGAASLTDVSSKCKSIYYYKDGSNVKGVQAKIVTVNGIKYWQVSGLTGTGGFSTKASGDPNTGYGNISNPIALVGLAAITVGIAVGGRRLSAQKKSAKR